MWFMVYFFFFLLSTAWHEKKKHIILLSLTTGLRLSLFCVLFLRSWTLLQRLFLRFAWGLLQSTPPPPNLLVKIGVGSRPPLDLEGTTGGLRDVIYNKQLLFLID